MVSHQRRDAPSVIPAGAAKTIVEREPAQIRRRKAISETVPLAGQVLKALSG